NVCPPHTGTIPIKTPNAIESAFISLESFVCKTSSFINCLKLFFLNFLNRFRGLLKRDVMSTKTVFRALIRVKSQKGRKCGIGKLELYIPGRGTYSTGTFFQVVRTVTATSTHK